jgi:hypothetical protein
MINHRYRSEECNEPDAAAEPIGGDSAALPINGLARDEIDMDNFASGAVSEPMSFLSQARSAGPGPTASFSSTSTDYDHLTCPGAQAEQDADYVQRVYAPFRACSSGTPNSAELTASAARLEALAAQVRSQAMVQAEMEAAYQQRCYEEMYGVGLPMQSWPQQQALAETPETVAAAAQSCMQYIPLWTSSMTSMPNQGTPGPVTMEQKVQVPVQTVRENREQKNTTVMLRNLPNDYTREMVLELLDEEGFRGKYDFVYVPLDFKRWGGLGYAFVNMVETEDALKAISVLNGFRRWRKMSQKVLEVVWGEPMQGLGCHLDRYRNSPVMHDDVPDEAKPVYYQNGVRVPFPPPTRKLRPPRAKR